MKKETMIMIALLIAVAVVVASVILATKSRYREPDANTGCYTNTNHPICRDAQNNRGGEVYIGCTAKTAKDAANIPSCTDQKVGFGPDSGSVCSPSGYCTHPTWKIAGQSVPGMGCVCNGQGTCDNVTGGQECDCAATKLVPNLSCAACPPGFTWDGTGLCIPSVQYFCQQAAGPGAASPIDAEFGQSSGENRHWGGKADLIRSVGKCGGTTGNDCHPGLTSGKNLFDTMADAAAYCDDFATNPLPWTQACGTGRSGKPEYPGGGWPPQFSCGALAPDDHSSAACPAYVGGSHGIVPSAVIQLTSKWNGNGTAPPQSPAKLIVQTPSKTVTVNGGGGGCDANLAVGQGGGRVPTCCNTMKCACLNKEITTTPSPVLT